MMKKAISIVLLLLAVTLAFASSEFLVVMRTDALPSANGQTLRQKMLNLRQQGSQIYYYNMDYVVSGLTDSFIRQHPEYPIHVLGQLPIMDNVYQVTKLPNQTKIDVDGFGAILYDIGEYVLISSPLNESRLRAQLRNPFFQYDFRPMVIEPESPISEPYTMNRTPIEQIISQVNPDSVMWFIQSLQDFQTRFAPAPNRLQVATWIRDQFIRMGITNATLSPFTWSGTTQYNVVATITGSVNPDNYVVVGGHHDSILNGGGDALTFAPGADDNASGAASALEMARVMMASNFVPQTSIRFVTFAAEEFGLWGSRDYAGNAYNDGQNIVLMINHDMIANSAQTPANWQVRLMPYDGFLDYTDYATELVSSYTTLNPTLGTSNSGSSDSHSFWAKGYPVIYFFEQVFSPYYHSVQDITANINPAYCAEVIRASAAVAATYSFMPIAPEYLSVQDVGNGHSLQVTWPNVAGSNVDHYNLYVGTLETGYADPIEVPAAPGEGTVYTIQNLTPGTVYYIAVSTVSNDGFHSNYTYGTGTPNLIPITPVNYHAEPNLGHVLLYWDANLEQDFAGYRVFRSTDATELGTQLGEGLVVATSYTDTQFPNPLQYYYYTICAEDLDGNQSAYSQTLRSRPVTLSEGILVIDETLDGSGSSPFQPTDEAVDTFYAGMLTPFTTTTIDAAETNALRLSDIGIYSSILWHSNDQVDFDNLHIYREDLKRYIELGGNVLLDVYLPTKGIELNGGYPVTFNPSTVISSGFGIGTANYSSSARFKYAQPILNNYPALTVDPLKTTTSFNGHIFKVESITANANAQNIYTYGSDYENDTNQGALNGLPIGVYYNHQPGKVITLSFPLYNMTQDSATQLVNHVFRYVFQESSPNDDPGLVSRPQITIYPNMPNPFNTNTNIRIDFANTKTPVNVAIYNLKGQLVQTLYHGVLSQAKTAVEWNGIDKAGTDCAAGIYFVRVTQNGKHSLRKIMKIK
ncbi:MAG: leucyl aminopeptidase [Candidatus Cloacimonetes bacterium HGW-Cloacimonetes-1]|jgi:hypothetical protein|nr:MAG: leucyl aminopeptidase [Candidatus Cloacimonetes bacterium HGW-Cloacimonetes-1]